MKIITISIRKPSVSAKSEERSADIFLKTASMSTFFQKTTGNLRGAADAASRLSDEIIKLGGCPCAENGIGKIKRPLLKKYLTAKEQALQQTIKDFFDPHHKLGAGEYSLNPSNRVGKIYLPILAARAHTATAVSFLLRPCA